MRCPRRNSSSARACCPPARYAVATSICAFRDSGSSVRARSDTAIASANRPPRISAERDVVGALLPDTQSIGSHIRGVGLSPLPMETAQDLSQDPVCSRERVVEFHRPSRRRFGLRHGFARRQRAAEQELELSDRELRIRLRKVRLAGDRLLEIGHRSTVALVGHSHGGNAFHVRFVCLRVDGQSYPSAATSRSGPAGGPRDIRRNLLLERQHLAQLAVIALRPDMAIRGGTDQLRRHAHARSRAHQRPFDHGLDLQLLADCRERLVRTLVLPRRGPRDHIETLHLSELCGQGIGDGIDEIRLCGIAGEVLEGENDQRADRRACRRPSADERLR